MSAMKRDAMPRRLARGRRLEQLDERAADHDRVGDVAHGGAVCASRMPKPTPTGRFTRALILGIMCLTASMSKWPAPVTPLSATW